MYLLHKVNAQEFFLPPRFLDNILSLEVTNPLTIEKCFSPTTVCFMTFVGDDIKLWNQSIFNARCDLSIFFLIGIYYANNIPLVSQHPHYLTLWTSACV